MNILPTFEDYMTYTKKTHSLYILCICDYRTRPKLVHISSQLDLKHVQSNQLLFHHFWQNYIWDKEMTIYFKKQWLLRRGH